MGSSVPHSEEQGRDDASQTLPDGYMVRSSGLDTNSAWKSLQVLTIPCAVRHTQTAQQHRKQVGR